MRQLSTVVRLLPARRIGTRPPAAGELRHPLHHLRPGLGVGHRVAVEDLAAHGRLRGRLFAASGPHQRAALPLPLPPAARTSAGFFAVVVFVTSGVSPWIGRAGPWGSRRTPGASPVRLLIAPPPVCRPPA